MEICILGPQTFSFVQANGVKYEVWGPEKHISKRFIEKASSIKVALSVMLRTWT